MFRTNDIKWNWSTLAATGISASLTVLLAACATNPQVPTDAVLTGGGAGDPDQFLIVDCLLPGQVRKLGRSATYLTARRAIKTSASICEIRGGEYVSYDRSDFRTSLNVWLPAAQQGDPKAQTYVGEIYEKGLGLDPDYQLAAQWYRKAAEQGFSRAQINLGHLYEQGLGVPKDSTQALNWYRKASGLTGDQLAFTSSISALEAQVQQSRQEAAEARRESGQLRQQINRLQGQLRQQNNNFNNNQQQLNKVRQQLQQERRKRSIPSIVIAPAQKPSDDGAAVRKLEQQVAAKEAEIAQLGQERGRIEQEAKLLEMRLQSESLDNAILRSQLDSVKQELATSQAELQTQQADVGQELKTLQADLTTKQAQLERAQQRLQQQQLQAAARDNTEIQQLSSTLLQQRQELASKEQLIQQLEQELTRSQDATVNEQLQEQRALVAQVEVQVASARQALAQYKNTIESQNNAEIAALKQQIAEQNQALQAQQARNQQLESVMSDLGTQLAEIRGRSVAVQEEEQNLQNAGGQVLAAANTQQDALATRLAPLDFGPYHALIIGNNEYADFPNLANAVNDARDIANVLRSRYGFNTQVLLNANRYDILSTLNTYREKLTEKDNFLLYYAGHGDLDRANDRGHWLPINAEPTSTANWVSNTAITDILNAMTAKHVLVIADSCYSGSLTRAVTTSIEGGRSLELQRRWVEAMIKTRSRTVITSGGLQPVLDGGGGRHSVFAKHLLAALQQNNTILEGPLLFRAIAKRFKSDGAARAVGQNPQYSPINFAGDLGAPFFFRPVES